MQPVTDIEQTIAMIPRICPGVFGKNCAAEQPDSRFPAPTGIDVKLFTLGKQTPTHFLKSPQGIDMKIPNTWKSDCEPFDLTTKKHSLS
jgi:hypothetical protein